MFMRPLVSAITMAALLAAAPAYAFDATGADILGLRLGMSETDVAARLARQGFPLTRLPDGCSGGDGCLVTAKAVTKDGELRIAFAGESGATLVRYVFLGHGPTEPERLKAAMIDRFGRPDQQKPMMWCRAVAADGSCPHQQASLSFVPETLTVTLKAGDTERP
jgi:hypothetical protein